MHPVHRVEREAGLSRRVMHRAHAMPPEVTFLLDLMRGVHQERRLRRGGP